MFEFPEEFVFENSEAYYNKGTFYIPGKFDGVSAVAALWPQPIFKYSSGFESKPPGGNNLLFIYFGSDYLCTIVEVSNTDGIKGEKLEHFRFETRGNGEKKRNFLGYIFDNQEIGHILLTFKYCNDFEYECSRPGILVKGVHKYEDFITIKGVANDETVAIGKDLLEELE